LAHTSGTTVLHLSQNGISSFKFALPPVDLIDKFEQIASALVSRQQVNNDQMRTLSTLRDSLLPRLISGQLEIPNTQSDLQPTTV
jgi:type I restriction enzyme S subunit